MTAISRALSRSTEQFGSISDTPRLDAELLMAAALGIGRDRLILDEPRGSVPAEFPGYVERRLAGEPIAYITGHRAFWTIDLAVGPGALIPRPDSETLIAAAVEHFSGTAGPKRILDLGTGPGTLLLAALDEWPTATGLGVDASPTALSYAQRNAERAQVAIAVQNHSLSDSRPPATAGLLLTNPPYGARIGDSGRLRDLYATLGKLAKGPYAEWTFGFVTTDPQLAQASGLAFTRTTAPLPHGGLRVKLYLRDADVTSARDR